MNNLKIEYNGEMLEVAIVNDGKGTLHIEIWNDEIGYSGLEIDANQNCDIASVIGSHLDRIEESEEVIRRGQVGRRGSTVERLDQIYNELDMLEGIATLDQTMQDGAWDNLEQCQRLITNRAIKLEPELSILRNLKEGK